MWCEGCFDITTTFSSFLDCFNDSQISFYSEELVDPSNWVYELNNNPNNEFLMQFPKANISGEVNYNYNPATGKAQQPIYFLNDTDGVEIVCTNCYAVFDASVLLELHASYAHWYSVLPTLTFFEMATGGRWKYNVDMLVQAQESYQNSASQQVAEFTLPTIEFCIGWVPVYIETVIPITVGYDVSVDGEATATAGFDMEGSYKLGMEYTAGEGWQPIRSSTFNENAHEPTIDVNIEAEVAGYVEPQLEFNFYGIAGPFVNVNPTLEMTFEDHNTNWCFDLEYKMEVDAGVEIAWPIDWSKSFDLYDYEADLYNTCGKKRKPMKVKDKFPKGRKVTKEKEEHKRKHKINRKN